MEVDAQELLEQKEHREELELEQDRAKIKLNTLVAVTIALLATFMGVCKIKDENIVLEMQVAQAGKIDTWNFYQARNIREDLMLSTSAILAKSDPAASADWKSKAKAQNEKKEKVKQDAEAFDVKYESLHARHDLFDLEDAGMAIAVSLFAITSLTQRKWLYGLAWIPAGLGVFMGLSGLLDWHIHAERLIKLLG